mgnify:CR=1 FL=1
MRRICEVREDTYEVQSTVQRQMAKEPDTEPRQKRDTVPKQKAEAKVPPSHFWHATLSSAAVGATSVVANERAASWIMASSSVSSSGMNCPAADGARAAAVKATEAREEGTRSLFADLQRKRELHQHALKPSLRNPSSQPLAGWAPSS